MSGITYDYMEEYIRSLLPQNTGALKEMEDYAKQNNIPIVQPETGNFLKLIINIKKPLNILELGTAIGYSSILMSMSAGGRCIVTTIERDTEMVKKAKENISKYGFDKNVNVVEGDCIEVLKSLKGSYDVIFIDAGKAHYNHFLPYCEKVLKEDGIIIADNVLFRGMVAYKDLVKRRKITIVKRMKSYLKLVSEERFITSVIPMGDGIAVTIRGKSYEKLS